MNIRNMSFFISKKKKNPHLTFFPKRLKLMLLYHVGKACTYTHHLFQSCIYSYVIAILSLLPRKKFTVVENEDKVIPMRIMSH